jgi:hypothetical protein
MAKPGAWGDHLTLQAIAEAGIVSSVGAITAIEPRPSQNPQKPVTTIVIGHLAKNYYVSCTERMKTYVRSIH